MRSIDTCSNYGGDKTAQR